MKFFASALILIFVTFVSNISAAQTVSITKITRQVKTGIKGDCLIIQTNQDPRLRCYLVSRLLSQALANEMRLNFLATLSPAEVTDPAEIPFVVEMTWQSATVYVFGRFVQSQPRFMQPALPPTAKIEDFGVSKGHVPTLPKNRNISKDAFQFNENLLSEIEFLLEPPLTTYFIDLLKHTNQLTNSLP